MTAPAATKAYSPTVTPQTIVQLAPRVAPLRIKVFRYSSLRVTAERALNKHLNGGCQVPIACYAVLEGDQIWLRGLVGDPNGSMLLTAQARGPHSAATELGIEVAEALLDQGAGAILKAVYGEAGHE